MSHSKNINLIGPAGVLEAQMAEPNSNPKACAVLCHPHPQYGGSMHDAVLATAESQFTQQNISTLRFNFRGVGGSEGSYDNGVGEAQDIQAAIEWMQKQHPGLPCVLLGYSFGAATAWRAASLSNTPTLAALWLVAAPISMMDMTGTLPTTPICLFHPDADDFTSLDTLDQWSQALVGEATGDTTSESTAPTIVIIDNANHFFAGAQDSLASSFAEQLTQLLDSLG